MKKFVNKLFYAVESRNGYTYIDEYINENGDKFSGCTRSVECFNTKKLAIAVCTELNTLAAEINELRSAK